MMVKKSLSVLISLISACLLSACASLTTGTKQTIEIQTHPFVHASCAIKNDKGTWFIPRTPGSVMIHRSAANLQIDCEKKGYRPAIDQVASTTNKSTYVEMIMIGGFVASGIDMASGAAYQYPSQIAVTMRRHELT